MGWILDTPDVSAVQSYRFQTKSIRLYPVEIRKQEGKHKADDESSLFFMYGSTNLNEKVVIASSIPLGSSGRLIQRRNYTFLGGCSLKPRSQKRLSFLNTPSAPHSSSQSNTSAEKVTTSNDSSKSDEHQDSCNDDIDFNSSDLVVGLEFSSGVDLDAGTRMYCHFANNPEDRRDRSVMIALKFNDIRAVIQAHGHLDGCSQFVKVDLGIGDRGGDALAAAGEKRFSCVLTSTFPCKPRHPNQCVLYGRLCSISELENALLDYYSSSSSSSSCQQGIAGKSDKESGKLKFLQGHIFVSICSGDYDLDGLARRQSARLLAASDGISAFERRLLDAERGRTESVIFMMSSNGEKFSCDLATIKCKWFMEICSMKSPALGEMIDIHGKQSRFGGPDSRVFSMKQLTAETVTALISYFNDCPLKQGAVTMISCQTAVSLIETGRKYNINNLEKYVSQLIVEEKEHLWFDITSLVNLFRLYSSTSSFADGEKVRFKILQAFQMKRREDDEERCIERLFREDPNTAGALLMEALTICSKHRPQI